MVLRIDQLNSKKRGSCGMMAGYEGRGETSKRSGDDSRFRH
jgi:hypothetical protein